MPLQRAMVTKPYARTVVGIGGTTPYRFTATGLPPGVKLAPNGKLSGNPTSAGQFRALITLTDAKGRSTTSSLPILVAKALVVPRASSLPQAKVRKNYKVVLRGVGGARPYRWSSAGKLPPGVRLSSHSTNAWVVGKPTRKGTYRFTVTVREKYGFSTKKAFRVVVR